jgi:signal transduction histidine kinase/ActR/RegA family two-component response regulator
MKVINIRARLLLAALLPVFLISTLLALVFLKVRFDDMQQAYQQRTHSVVRQLALASEYGLFSANKTQLQALLAGVLREPDVRWVAILDGRGLPLVSAGDTEHRAALPFSAQEDYFFDASRHLDWFAQPVMTSGVRLDDLYEDAGLGSTNTVRQLGQVLVTFSRHAMDDRKRDMFLLGSGISLAGMLFGIFLAVRLSRGVIRPMMRISGLIERIGRGDFFAVTHPHSAELADDPFRDLHANLYRMAQQLAGARDQLEYQVTRATQALREKKNEAEMANQAKSRFLAAASHDLRQPTHALGMFITRLAQLPHDAQTRQLIGNLEASVQAMQSLLDGLLDISRLDAQVIQVTKRPFAVQGLFDQLNQVLSQTALEQGLHLRLRASPLWVLSDATLLYRVLLNLVGNALRYTERGGVLVACRLHAGGRQVRIEVWDSGIGIAPEHLESVFKEFYQVANPARNRNKGLGLGLNIVQRSCQLLEHPLQVVSRVGAGTRFTLVLPLAQPVAQVGLPAQTGLSASDDLQGRRVLVVEDDALVRAALVGLLQTWGLTVHEAEGLAQARQWLRSGVVPDVIISDYRLDDVHNGIDVVMQLRTMLGMPIAACLMSGDTDVALMHAAQSAGLTLLHKPVRPAKLRSLLRRQFSGQPTEVDLR